MNKWIAIMLSLTLLLATPTPVLAAFTSDTKVYKTASITVTGAPGIPRPLSVTIKNVSGDGVVSQITWDPVAAASIVWKAAKQYIEVQGFETYANWGIQIYTDNKRSTASPKYTGPGNPAGLVSASNTAVALPMCWRLAVGSVINDEKFAAGSLELRVKPKYIATTEDTVLLDGHETYVSDTDYFAPWFWMLDKYDLIPTTSGFQTQYGPYATFVDTGRAQIAPETYISVPYRGVYYRIYIGANFATAAAGVLYKTNSLTIEMYHL